MFKSQQWGDLVALGTLYSTPGPQILLDALHCRLGLGTQYASIAHLIAAWGPIELWLGGWDPVSGIWEVFFRRQEESGVQMLELCLWESPSSR